MKIFFTSFIFDCFLLLAHLLVHIKLTACMTFTLCYNLSTTHDLFPYQWSHSLPLFIISKNLMNFHTLRCVFNLIDTNFSRSRSPRVRIRGKSGVFLRSLRSGWLLLKIFWKVVDELNLEYHYYYSKKLKIPEQQNRVNSLEVFFKWMNGIITMERKINIKILLTFNCFTKW